MSADDTVVALATAPGQGRRAVIRLSGARAHALLRCVLNEVPELRARELQCAQLELGDGLQLPVELLSFFAPRSATGEDVAELHLPSWPPVVAKLLAALVDAGARVAQRGEFARRALALGKLDLAQVQALGALGNARDAESADAALATLLNGAAAQNAALREELLGVLALLEAHVDHEEEDTEALGDGELQAALAALGTSLASHVGGAARRARPDAELDVVLLGPPNAGKSSLMLALCPDALTTPSPLAGTTRDMLEARREVAGRALRLLDGPGLRWEPPLEDSLDQLAMRRFLEQLPPTALVLDVEDLGEPSSAAERARRAEAAGERARVLVGNKCDLASVRADPERLSVSARSGEGLAALLAALLERAPEPAPSVATDALQERLLSELSKLVEEAQSQADPAALPLVALALREAVERLDAHEQRAADVDEELLDRIFAGFCVGK